MQSNIIATAGLIAAVSFPGNIDFNHLPKQVRTDTVVYEIKHSNSAENSEFLFCYNYIEESFSLKDAADLLAKGSRGFSPDEATSYKAFIDDFFA